MIQALEQLSLSAWPALEQVFHDGWIVRFSNGYTRRANSVNPIHPGTLPTSDKINFSEQFYRTRKQRVIFKMTQAAEPADLDSILESRGYKYEAPSLVMNAKIEALLPQPSARVESSPFATDQWLDAYASLNSVQQPSRDTLSQIIRSIELPICCARILDRGSPVCCGLAVLQGKWVGLFDIVTHPQRRRQGLANELIRHLVHWAITERSENAYLQVMLDNDAALRLYQKMTFAPSYRYWYRVKE